MRHHFSLKLLLLSILCMSMPFSVLPLSFAQGQELVTNGGFENALKGWKAVNSYSVNIAQGYYDALSHPPHSGQYSAKVGTASKPGTLSQVVTIPAKSKAKFSAWYRTEQGASLTIVLKASDGSTIQQWTESGSQAWTPITYDVSTAYAGQPVTIEFDGHGNEQLISQTYYCMDQYGYLYLCPQYSYADYFAFVDDVSMVASLAQYVSSVNVAGLPPSLSTKLYVDGTQVGTVEGGQSQQLTFTIGETHSISVDSYISQDNRTRYYCESSSTSVSTDTQLTFSYKKQYYLSVTSPYGTTSGTGWYDDGSTVPFSLDTRTIPMPGLVGPLGARYVFDKWAGDMSTSDVQSSVVMDGPKSISATWRTDYSILYLIIVVIAAAVVGGIVAYRRLSRRRRDHTMVYDERGPVVIDVTPPVTEVTGPGQAPEEVTTKVAESESTQIAEESKKTEAKHRRRKKNAKENPEDGADRE